MIYIEVYHGKPFFEQGEGSLIYTLTLNPAVDKTMVVPSFQVDKVNRSISSRKDAGGKGINVSRWVRMFGGESIAMGVLGGDTGQFIAQTLADEGIQTDFIWRDIPTRTNIKVIDAINNTCTDINEPGEPMPQDIINAVERLLDKRVQSGDIVVISGRVPQGVPKHIIPGWIEKLRERGARCAIDVDAESLQACLQVNPWLIKPNREELAACMGMPLDSRDAVMHASSCLASGGIAIVAVSLGGDGFILQKDKSVIDMKAIDVPVLSTVGAGDAMLAALIYAQQVGMDLKEAAAIAAAAGAASVMQEGTFPASLSLIQALKNRVEF